MVDTINLEFGSRLRQAIGVRSLREVAKSSGLSRQYIGMLLSGKRVPTIDVVRKLAEALWTRPEWLAYGRGKAGETK